MGCSKSNDLIIVVIITSDKYLNLGLQTIGRESETAIHREGRPPSSIREALCIQRAPQADSSLFNNR